MHLQRRLLSLSSELVTLRNHLHVGGAAAGPGTASAACGTGAPGAQSGSGAAGSPPGAQPAVPPRAPLLPPPAPAPPLLPHHAPPLPPGTLTPLKPNEVFALCSVISISSNTCTALYEMKLTMQILDGEASQVPRARRAAVAPRSRGVWRVRDPT